MRKQPYPVVQLTGGLDISVDPVFLADTASPNIQNIRFGQKLAKKDFNRRLLGDEDFTTAEGGLPLSGAVMNISVFTRYDGTTRLMVTTVNKTYVYNTTSRLYSDINVSNWTGGQDDRFSVVPALDSSGNSIVILTNGVDKIKKWDGELTSTLTNLLGWSAASIEARQLVMYGSRLVACHTIESGTACPTRVRWTTNGDVEDITGTGSGFVELVETPDWCVKPVMLKGRLFVIKERSIWQLVYVGGTTVFVPEVVLDNIGSSSPDSIAHFGDFILLHGNDDVYIFDGLNASPLAAKIRPYLFETEHYLVNQAKFNRVVAAYDGELRRYLISFPGRHAVIPRKTYAYYFGEESWTWRQEEITAIGFYHPTLSVLWEDLVGSWRAQTWKWMERDLQAGAPLLLTGDSSGYVYESARARAIRIPVYRIASEDEAYIFATEDGVYRIITQGLFGDMTEATEYACYETKDFVFEHAVRWVEFRTQIRYGEFTIQHSVDGGETWSGGRVYAEAANWTDFVYWLNETSQKIRFKIETRSEELEIKWIEPWYLPRTRALKPSSS
jgi:hypothetical protein